MKKSAFTLIELLVVIAIIAILAGIALPVFNRVMERSKVTNCANNLRQIGMGIQSYLNDNDEQMFSLNADSGTNATPWTETLVPKYVNNWKVFRSPFDKITAQRPDVQSSGSGAVPVSYGLNLQTFDINTSKFNSPSQLIVAAPLLQRQGNRLTFQGTNRINTIIDPSSLSPGNKNGTHNSGNGTTALHGDWHVENLLWIDYANTGTPAGLKRWFPRAEDPVTGS